MPDTLAADAPAADRQPASDASADALVEFIERHPRLFVLTGAGCSTDSGIPDYRDATGEWKRAQPMMLGQFLSDARARQRYWARSVVGFQRLRAARPNDAHVALAHLEDRGRIALLVTQNVDGLHQAAGSRNVVDLHGRIDTVRCMSCGTRTGREPLQAELVRRNPDFAVLDAPGAPDGDADLDHAAFDRFDVPACGICGGVLKPDVVFFGEGVPRDRVNQAMDTLEVSDAMLVVGSSLMVYSGYRFARAMADLGKPIAALNMGRTRADDLLTWKVEGRCADVLSYVLRATGDTGATREER
jgi:NAD-dependent SIR2 family protein deacetylase